MIKNAQYRTDERPLMLPCDCYTCQHHSRAYLRHLFIAGEILGLHLNTLHNVTYYLRLMAQIRQGQYATARSLTSPCPSFNFSRLIYHIPHSQNLSRNPSPGACKRPERQHRRCIRRPSGGP